MIIRGVAFACALFASAPLHAESLVSREGAGCDMQTQVNLQVSYNMKAASFAEAQKVAAEQNAKIQQLAGQQKVSGFKLQSENANIDSQPMHTNPDGTVTSFTYHVSGSLSYVLTNATEAAKFADFLSGQKMQVTINSSSYRNC